MKKLTLKTLFLACLIFTISSCGEDENFPNQVGEWDIIIKKENFDLQDNPISESETVATMTLRTNETGVETTQNGTYEFEWDLFANDTKIVLIRSVQVSSGAVLTSYTDMNILVNESNYQEWQRKDNNYDTSMGFELIGYTLKTWYMTKK